ncbi:hypothetical protein AC579_8638 [Pseudocercospora musae]|uniref:Cytochrome P450 n=1 Tax=Pseudocercospora musae TaxID=113226 RepID=A0A139IFK3_9PEZI|nr:hypothetical protein AC579_8638 [Pseudocercospora musae]KXT13499.1 hypothetical protein AC579_8638 [Pseudocercospora musae]
MPYSDHTASLLCIFVIVLAAACLHRLYLHPLAKIPGPFLAKFTNARFLYHAWKGDLHLDHLRCHKKYGPVYRSGPNRVVFQTLTAAHAIYSNDRTIRKSDGYTSHPWTRAKIPSLFNCVDNARAALKKKTLRPAIAQPALALHNSSVEDNVELLVNLVKDGQPEDLSKTGFYYALDVISQSVFGYSFRCMHEISNRWMAESLERGNRFMYLHLAWPFLFQTLGLFLDVEPLAYPQYHQESKMFLDLCEKSRERGRTNERGSIFEFMKSDLPKEVSDEELQSDAYSFMRGGGDMVAVTIAATLFYITQNPAILEKLKHEIRTKFDRAPPKLDHQLESCTYLRACVDEALRMAPPGPGVFWRQSSSDLVIDGVHLPAGTEFGVSIYAVHYNGDIFDEPEVYSPERMIVKEGETWTDRAGLIPFLRGFRACPAQKLAYATILLPIARFIWEFELEIERTGSVRAEETTMIDGTKLFPQVDVFGSRIEGPVISFRPRV